MSVWSLMPPHCGKNGPCATFCGGADVCGTSFELGSEPEHAANIGIMAAASTASALALRLTPVLGVTPCTVAAAVNLNHRHAD